MKNDKRIMSVFILAVGLSLVGCGNTTPVPDENTGVEDTETLEGSTETDETTEETANKAETSAEEKTETKDSKAAEAAPEPVQKPASEPAAAPKSAASKPEQPPHTHDYVETLTKQPTCGETGQKTLTCACGDVKTETIPATGQHNWAEITNVVHHEALGHEETVEEQVQVGTTDARHEYECAYCGERFDTPEAKDEHQRASGDFDHAMARTYVYDYPGEPIYETQTKTVWVVDQEAYDSVEVVGYKCSVCGQQKA